jgi:hypothetical protein
VSAPILVTGAHRSGTTWIGKMLALAPGTGYLHEPFNPVTPPGISGARFDRFFAYVTADNASPFEEPLRRTLGFDYGWGRQLRAIHSPGDALHTVRDGISFARARMRHACPVMKDPIALFSAEWLAETFGMDVVITVRHPAAFAASLLRLGWTHDFGGFAEDERLLRDRLPGFETEIRAQAARPGDVLEQAILLWRICYRTVDGYRARHPEWVVVRHEDVSQAPLASFESLYGRLGLQMTDRARREIEHSSSASNPAEARSKHDVHVDSRAAARGWRRHLDHDTVERIRAGTADVWPLFYSDEDW